MQESIFDKKTELLENFLGLAVFNGLSAQSLLMAGRQIGLNEGQVSIIAPNGVISIIDYWFSMADEFMVENLNSRQGLKIREKATLAIRSRLEYFSSNKEAFRKAIALLALPTNALRALAIGNRFSDLAWRTLAINRLISIIIQNAPCFWQLILQHLLIFWGMKAMNTKTRGNF